nr:hypothetical protein Iba_chr08cCG3280 [Ipomoea batatas]
MRSLFCAQRWLGNHIQFYTDFSFMSEFYCIADQIGENLANSKNISNDLCWDILCNKTF